MKFIAIMEIKKLINIENLIERF